jgi:3-deoxy-D-manno-octulosonate 8-phosphate phosphatase (KDO 8-P phosphatase)
MTPAAVAKRARAIRVLLTDVDGCLTDNTLYYSPDGKGGVAENKGFSSQDGMAIRWLEAAGITVGWISGRDSPATTARATMLGVKYLYQNRLEKIEPLEEILRDCGATDKEVCYIGDDLPDAPLMKRAGLAIAVGNAVPEIKRMAHYVTKKSGGYGAVREVVELLLKSQGKWKPILTRYGIK